MCVVGLCAGCCICTYDMSVHSLLNDTLTHALPLLFSLKAMEDTLETLQSVQGVSMVELEEQLQESKDILNTMDRDLQSEIVRALVGVILAADTDKDFLLSDAEIDDIIHKMEAIHGVQLKEDLLKSIVIEQGRSIKSIMAVARNLMIENDPEKNIFSFIET
jgi:hypothetical protein